MPPPLVIVAMSLLIAVILVGSFIHAYLFASLQGASASTVYQYVAVNGWAIRILNVVGIGFLLTAVFVGRAPAPDPDE